MQHTDSIAAVCGIQSVSSVIVARGLSCLETHGMLLEQRSNLISLHWQADWASLVAWMVKRLPTMRETQVRSLGQEDPLEKEMATHSSIHAWKIP